MLVYKQLTRQIMRNKSLVALLLVLTIITSISFFFVVFSIDGNIAKLNALHILSKNQQLYKSALEANTTLAYTFFICLICLTAFVFVMFFYRFCRSNKKQIGCIKSLGFKDNILRLYFVVFTTFVSIVGALLGLVGGYFLSSVLIVANEKTYMVTGIIKRVGVLNLLLGLLGSTAVFAITSFFCYCFVAKKEPGGLMAGNQDNARFSALLGFANKITEIIPTKNKFALRIALRKPLSVALIMVAVMSFSVCMILGRSLNISSEKVFKSQTMGHNYEYDTKYSKYQQHSDSKNVMIYLQTNAQLMIGKYNIAQTMLGLGSMSRIYEVQNTKGELLCAPLAGTVYINPGICEIYGVKKGDALLVEIEGTKYKYIVAQIATNANSATIYMNANELSKILGVSADSYNRALSMQKMPGGVFTTKEQRIDELKKNSVSNNVSALINQITGAIVGAILIFLALYINFQDNTNDILVLHMLGYKVKGISKMLIDVYRPIVRAAFILTIIPSIFVASSIQKGLSISTNDYMPFGTNVIVILMIFIALDIIYSLVKNIFRFGINKTIEKEQILEYILW